ncbi:MAG: IPT/TIG domain-containing protein [Prevotellaceae bacterium]|jgi:hypothetical protein|nr:IPT/TIG domain-containing protein [Prevotellaceae bacterium]
MKKFYSILIVAAILFSACEDNKPYPQPKGTVPAATSISPNENVKAGTVVSIEGTNLDSVKQIRFGEKSLVEKDSFLLVSATKIEFELPKDAPSGEVYLVAAESYVPNVLAGTISVVYPTLQSVTPENITGGTQITLTGTDLDLVQYIEIGGTRLMNIAPDTLSGFTLLTADCPDNIVGGQLKIFSYNGKEIAYETPFNEILPVITSISPDEADPQGGTLTIAGTGLESVAKVLVGDLELTNIVKTPTLLTAEYSSDIAEGQLKLVTTNGTEVLGRDIMLQIIAPAPDSISATVFQGGILVIGGNYLKDVLRIDFSTGGNVLAKDFLSQSHWKIVLRMPANATIANGVTATLRAYSDAAHSDFYLINTDAFNVYQKIPTDYAIFNFDGANSIATNYYSTANELETSLDGTAYGAVSAEITSEPITILRRGSRPNMTGFVYNNSKIALAVNVKEIPFSLFNLKFYLKVNGKDFYQTFTINNAVNGWYRIELPISDFATAASEQITEADFNGSFALFALISDTSEGNVNFLIDNVVFITGN